VMMRTGFAGKSAANAVVAASAAAAAAMRMMKKFRRVTVGKVKGKKSGDLVIMELSDCIAQSPDRSITQSGFHGTWEARYAAINAISSSLSLATTSFISALPRPARVPDLMS
jgi:hypothetical protein